MLFKRLNQRDRDQSGAALVEGAIVIPVLMVLVLGIMELGFLFRDYLTLSNMTRSGARVGSAAATNGDADFRILQSITGANSALNMSDVEYIVVFKADSASGPVTKPITPCLSGSVPNQCNHYSIADTKLPVESFGGSGVDGAYPPSGRASTLSGPGPERLGIYIRMKHHWLTGMFGTGTTEISDATVMRLEPDTK